MDAESSVLDDFLEHPKNGCFDSELERLANLSPLEYDTERESKAKELGVRVGTLDKEVAKRRETESESESCEVVEEISPWDEPVNGALLTGETEGRTNPAYSRPSQDPSMEYSYVYLQLGSFWR